MLGTKWHGSGEVMANNIGKYYQIETELGSGGMGTVYRGFDTRSQQPVAIKRLNAELIADNAEILDRFRREGEAELLSNP